VHPASPGTSFLWDAPVGGSSPTGYRLYWGTSSGSYPNGPHEDAGFNLSELHNALGLAVDTTYFVVARAYNGDGESVNSNEIRVRNGAQV
jgi:hypothetical protein